MAKRREQKGKRKGIGRGRILADCDVREGSLSLLPREEEGKTRAGQVEEFHLKNVVVFRAGGSLCYLLLKSA